MKKIILSALIFLISMPIVQSQVTIGSGEEPGKAALLDLKTKVPGTDNVTIEVGKPGGLVLPRVQLVSETTLEPFIDKNSSEWTVSANQNNNKKWHTGMMVYNLKNDGGFTPGIYFWDGAKWVAAKNTATTVAANNGLNKSGDNIQLGGDLITNTTVDPKTFELDFKGGLKIKDGGKIFMERVRTNAPQNTEKVATLGIDDETGEVYTMKAYPYDPDATTKALNYLEFQLTGEGDWIQNFNTKISRNAYTLVVVGYRFAPYTAKRGIKPGTELTSDNATPVVNVFADKYYRSGENSPVEQSVWYIHADYAEASPADNKDGTWTINCLVINNSLVKVYANPISYGKTTDGHNGTSLNGAHGQRDVEAKTAPAGLR
jgi:hypothetical protein